MMTAHRLDGGTVDGRGRDTTTLWRSAYVMEPVVGDENTPDSQGPTRTSLRSRVPADSWSHGELPHQTRVTEAERPCGTYSTASVTGRFTASRAETLANVSRPVVRTQAPGVTMMGGRPSSPANPPAPE